MTKLEIFDEVVDIMHHDLDLETVMDLIEEKEHL